MAIYQWCTMKFESRLSFYLLAIFIVLLWIKWLMWLWGRREFYRLSMKLSGPLSLPIIGSLPQLLKLASKKDAIHAMCSFVLSYSGFARFWLGPDLVIFISKPEDIEVIMKSKSISAKPPRFFDFATEMLGAGVLTILGIDSKWKTHRRIMSPSFNTAQIRSYQPILQRHSEIFLKDLELFVGKGTVRFQTLLARYVGDAVTESLMDFNPNFRAGKDDDVIHALDVMTDTAFKKIYKVWYYLDFLYDMSTLKKRQVAATNAVMRYAKIIYKAKLKECLEEKDLRPCVIQSLLEHKVRGELEEIEVLDEIKTIWAAGVDTMIGDSSWVFLILAIHKEDQEKVFQEIKEYYKDNKDAPVENDDLAHFPYLDMCMKEILRLFPVAPINFRYLTEELTLKHRNLTIPPYTTLAISLIVSHRDPEIWENPNDFIPSRFGAEETSKRHQYAYYPFSGGNRNCIGQRYGYHFLKTMAVYVIRKYEIHSDLKFKDVELYYDVNVKPKKGFMAEFRKREW